MICDKNVAVGEEPEEYMDIDKADHENDHRWDIEDYLFEQFKEMKIEGSLNNSKQRSYAGVRNRNRAVFFFEQL